MSRRRERRAKSKKRRAKILEGVELEPKVGHITKEAGDRQKRFYERLIERNPE